ncbi:54S ribosomal protein L12, mitochondrial [Smittium culicis]|uniref:54S ribosomal protein L12, mitochondrial n=1 Tax=Smittium culicis TaxID=133412 RepID=A0A1R1WYE9_9FUNG|nr:54S ribosomal protein L12, mitochondrial [Smittium culicis]
MFRISSRIINTARFVANPATSRAFSVTASRASPAAAGESNPLPIPNTTASAPVDPKLVSIIDDISKLTLLETSQLVDALKARFNITEAIHVASGPAQPAAAAAAPVEPAAKSDYTIKLDKFDPAQKAKVIREIKALLPELNLIAAKKFVEEAPKVIKENVPKDEAEKIKATLEALGATIHLE